MNQTYEASIAERDLTAIPQKNTEEVSTQDDEVFVLPPLDRKRMTARVVKTQISPFRYIDEDHPAAALED